MCNKSDTQINEPLPSALVLKQITEEQLMPIRQFCTAIGMVLNESGTPKAESEKIGKLLSISALFLARTLNATFLARRELVELNNQTLGGSSTTIGKPVPIGEPIEIPSTPPETPPGPPQEIID